MSRWHLPLQGGQHDSVEDARAALHLAALKFRHGPGWGCGTESGGRTERLMNVLSEAGCRATLVDRAQACVTPPAFPWRPYWSIASQGLCLVLMGPPYISSLDAQSSNGQSQTLQLCAQHVQSKLDAAIGTPATTLMSLSSLQTDVWVKCIPRLLSEIVLRHVGC